MRLVITEQAEKDLLDIDIIHRARIQTAVDRMLSNPRGSDLKKLLRDLRDMANPGCGYTLTPGSPW